MDNQRCERPTLLKVRYCDESFGPSAAFGCEPTEQVLHRAKVYAAAGADLLMPIGPKDADNVARFIEAARIPVTINMATGLAPSSSSAGLSMGELRALGVRRVSFPNLLPVLSVGAMQSGLAALRTQAEASAFNASPAWQPVPPDATTAALKTLMQDQDWLALENRLLAYT